MYARLARTASGLSATRTLRPPSKSPRRRSTGRKPCTPPRLRLSAWACGGRSTDRTPGSRTCGSCACPSPAGPVLEPNQTEGERSGNRTKPLRPTGRPIETEAVEPPSASSSESYVCRFLVRLAVFSKALPTTTVTSCRGGPPKIGGIRRPGNRSARDSSK